MASSPTLPLLWFFVMTIIYFFFKVNTNDPTQQKVFVAVYLLLVVIGEYFINLSLTEETCGTRQWEMALSITFIPWLLIFGVLNLFLLLFPDWLAPFSNTFGYGIAKLMGLTDFFNTLLKEKTDDLGASITPETKALSEALEHIYADKSLLINEISNVDDFFNRMKQLLKPNMQNDVKAKEKLQYFVGVKNAVSEFVWYILSGTLVTSITYNYIVNMQCVKSAADLERQQRAYENSVDEGLQDEQATPTVYTKTT
jgi:hypothetical protein